MLLVIMKDLWHIYYENIEIEHYVINYSIHEIVMNAKNEAA